MKMPYDANDPVQVERAEEEGRTTRARLLDDVSRVVDSDAGRRFVWRLLEAAHCFHISFSADPCLTAFREGERNLGLMILTDLIEACPDRLADMARENDASAALAVAAGVRRPS